MGAPADAEWLPQWSYQRTFHHDWPPTIVCRLWEPRCVIAVDQNNVSRRAGVTAVYWIDDPGEQKEALLAAVCEAFMLRMPEG